LRDTAHQCCRRQPNYATQNEHFHQVPSAKVKHIWLIQIAGAKQPSNGAVKNNFCSFPLSSQNATAALIFRSLTKNEGMQRTWSL